MKDQKGFTLVELLVGMAILSIVAAAITSFIVAGSRSYAAANTEIVVQQEAQLAMNQMSDVIIDTTRSVNYVGYSSDGSVSQQAVKDADFTIDVEDKSLTLFNGTATVVVDANGNPVLDADGNPELEKNADGKIKIDGGSGNDHNYQFYWDKSEEKLYYSEIPLSDEDFPEGERKVLAEYVKDFSVDLSQVEEKRVVQLTISYEYNNRIYDTSNNITIRNKVLVNSVNLAVNKSIEMRVIPREYAVVLEPGEDYYKFSTPRIEGKNIIDKSVTWSISSEFMPSDAGTTFTDAANGIIHIASGETEPFFKVTVTTNAEDSAGNHASEDVIVYVKRAKKVNLIPSEGVFVRETEEYKEYKIPAGSNITISANVDGNKLGVTCSNCGDDTTIDRYVVDDENQYKWSLIDANGICDWVSGDHDSAEVKIKSSAQAGQMIIIEATSLLSTTTNQNTRPDGTPYGREKNNKVTGQIRLIIEDNGGDLTLDGDGLRYGSRDLYLNWDYVPHTAYVCVRIKELGKNTPAADDKVMIYKTDGKAILISPDVLGLDLNFDYDLSIQVLAADYDPYSHNDIQTMDEIVADYLANSTSGTYTGSLKSSSVLPAKLLKPQLAIDYNGDVYTGKEINVGSFYFLSSDARSERFYVDGVSNAIGNVANAVYTNLYLGDGEGNPLYEWGASTTGKTSRGLLEFNTSTSREIWLRIGKVDPNNFNSSYHIDNAKESIGNYHYIPCFTYSNGTVAQPLLEKGYYAHNYTPNYDEQLCVRPESKINFSITDKGTLTLWAYTNNNEFKKGEILFPLPSESSFYFTKEQDWQTVVPYNSFIMQDSNGNIRTVEFSRINGRYISTSDSYEIEIFYKCTDSFWNQKVEMSAGVFKCPANGNYWNPVGGGTLDRQLEDGNYTVKTSGNATIKVDGTTYDAYVSVPTPTEGTFTQPWWGGLGFNLTELQTKGKQTVNISNNGISISYKKDTYVAYAKCTEATCEYKDGTYTMTLKYEGSDNPVKLTMKEGSSSWTVVKE